MAPGRMPRAGEWVTVLNNGGGREVPATAERGAIGLEGAGDARGGAAAWCAAVLLVGICFAVWPRGFLYPNYAGAVLFQCCALFMALVWAFPAGVGGSGSRRAHTGVVLLAVYGLFTALSFLYARHPRLAAIGSIRVVLPVAWGLMLARTIRRRGHYRFLLRTIVVAGVAAALMGLVYVGVFRKRDALQMVLGHRNFLSIFLLGPILFCVADLYGHFRRLMGKSSGGGVTGWPWQVCLALAVIMLVTFVLCGAIGAWLGLALGVGCLAAQHWTRRRRWAAVGAVAGCAVIALAVMSAPDVERWMAGRQQLQRWFLWKGAGRMFAEHPLTGWGTGMFLPCFQLYKPQAPMRYGLLTQLTLHPHNELLLIAVEGGLAGLALYVGGLAAGLRALFRSVERSGDARRRARAWALLAAVVAMFVQGTVTVSLRYWGPSAIYWTLIGLILAEPSVEVKSAGGSYRAGRARWGRVALFLLVAAGVVAGLWQVVWPGLKAEWLLKGAYGRMRNAEGKVVGYRKVWAAPFGFRYVPATVEERARDFDEAQRCSRYLPDYFRVLTNRGDFYRSLGDYVKAFAAYRELERDAPGYDVVRRVLGEVCLAQAVKVGGADAAASEGFLEKACYWYEKALEQNPYDVPAHYGYAQALLRRDELTGSTPGRARAVAAHLRAAVEGIEGGRYGKLRAGTARLVGTALELYGERDAIVAEELRGLRAKLSEFSSPARRR